MERPQILGLLALALSVNRVEAWWGAGAPECAQPCLSSAWSATSTTAWPAPTDWCDSSKNSDIKSRIDAASSCLVSACSATPTAHSSYSSLSSSLCAQYSSCSSAGSTGVYTVSLPAFTGAWDGGHGGGPGGGWGGHGGQGWTQTGTGKWGPHAGWAGTATWTGGVYTVTGCEWDGSPWAGGPWGFGHGGGPGHGSNGDYGNGQPNGPWGAWGSGWTLTSTGTKTITAVQTITKDATGVDGSVTKVVELATSTGLATIGYAVNEDSKAEATTVLEGVEAAASTTGSSSNAASGGMGESVGVKVVAAVLGGVVVVAGLL
ncbi:hypothetical protein SMACR_05231 [Sordaria macrospora]|uniref:WGS project CABT00000000 data, contig 2.8 n=2 Tax=Sordaria macrospora TaxID=5147 RepID=F7VV08_SORMK|nr:uncharacterized protein SMAC_05231 [Sordaria macrospora k-hell]KAA8632681.1 hypothetical protein SMACR_05231 [Sordaria macrospora]WPJ57347.1 hypothetical protein SMAC4_05231 [Sordaria macrospora]CCC09354.1 unnamed protein product [Sordaria macrospora k-hell]